MQEGMVTKENQKPVVAAKLNQHELIKLMSNEHG